MPWIPMDTDEGAAHAFLRPFKRRSKFLLDENVDPELAIYMRSKGLNARTIVEEGRAGASDEVVFQLARKQRRILLTRDRLDFWNDRRFPLEQTHGIAVLSSDDPR